MINIFHIDLTNSPRTIPSQGLENEKIYYIVKVDDNQEVILDLQNFLKDEGFDISVDGKWGNQTYKTANKYLVNKQLDNYDFNNFSEDQFLDQIYKESTGKPNKNLQQVQ